MKVGELIQALSQHDPELPVALADWNEELNSPNLDAAKHMSVGTTTLWNGKEFVKVRCVILGEEPAP